MSDPISRYIDWCKWVKDTQSAQYARESFEFEYTSREIGDKLARVFVPDSDEYYECWDAMELEISKYSDNACEIWSMFRAIVQ